MGCCNSVPEEPRPNLFQRQLCLHQKVPATNYYTVLHELGKGAFGIVEEVQHKKTKRHFAMKTVTFQSGSKRVEFEKEMDILRGLHHPNIVRMVETFEDDHHFYIIMELCKSGTLFDHIKEKEQQFPEDVVQDIVGKLASVVHYLHSRNICHRDLKLENVLMESEEQGGDIKLCDFGASTLFRMGVSMRKVLGSVVYMAPEVLEGNYTQSCDLWSLGVIMYMLLSDTPPFHGASEEELIEKIFDADVKFIDPVWDSVSCDAKSLIKKLLNSDPAKRYTASQVLKHPWIKAGVEELPLEVYEKFVPRIVAFATYSPLLRAALVAVAFCASSSYIRQHSKMYNELNTAHNGILSLGELRQAEQLKPFNLDIDRLYQALDQKHEQGVNLLEFAAATMDIEAIAKNEDLMKKSFRLFDREQTGNINKSDMMYIFGEHFDEDLCQEMIRLHDFNKDGQLDIEDFAKMLKQAASRRIRVNLIKSAGSGGQNALLNKSLGRSRGSVSSRSYIEKFHTDDTPILRGCNPKRTKRFSSGPTKEASETMAALPEGSGAQQTNMQEASATSRNDALEKIRSFLMDLEKNPSMSELSITSTSDVKTIHEIELNEQKTTNSLSVECRSSSPTKHT